MSRVFIFILFPFLEWNYKDYCYLAAFSKAFMWNFKICRCNHDCYWHCLLYLWEEVSKPGVSTLQISAQAKGMFSSSLSFLVFSQLYPRNKAQWRDYFERIFVTQLRFLKITFKIFREIWNYFRGGQRGKTKWKFILDELMNILPSQFFTECWTSIKLTGTEKWTKFYPYLHLLQFMVMEILEIRNWSI